VSWAWIAVSLALSIISFTPQPVRAGLSANAQVALDTGLQHLYALDYVNSRAAFRRLIEQEPDNPFGYLFEAASIWWQASQEHGLFKDTPPLERLFEEDIQSALNASDIWIKTSDRVLRADGYFASGMALGTRGQWSLMQGHWLKAYLDGKKAVRHLKKCVTIDEGYLDAYLGLGAFDYQVSHFSGIFKLSFLVGVHGDKQRGLDHIQLAMNQGRFARTQAAEFLFSIYISDEHDYPRALPILRDLRKLFPHSPYFQFLEVVLRDRLGDFDGSLVEAHNLFMSIHTDPHGFERKWFSLLCGITEDQCLAQPDLEKASVWLDHALGSTSDSTEMQEWRTVLRLFRAYVYDLRGDRAGAMAEYGWVSTHPAWGDSVKRAQECSHTPCTTASMLRYMRTLSRGIRWTDDLKL